MMKAEKGSEIITTICEYENSVAMPDNERLTLIYPTPEVPWIDKGQEISKHVLQEEKRENTENLEQEGRF